MPGSSSSSGTRTRAHTRRYKQGLLGMVAMHMTRLPWEFAAALCDDQQTRRISLTTEHGEYVVIACRHNYRHAALSAGLVTASSPPCPNVDPFLRHGGLTIQHLPAVTNIRFLSIMHFSSIHNQRLRPFRVLDISLPSRLSIERGGCEVLTAANSRCREMAALHCEKQWHEGKRAVGRFACLGIGAELETFLRAGGRCLGRDATWNMEQGLVVPLEKAAVDGDARRMGRTRGGAYTTNKKQMKRYTCGWAGHGLCCLLLDGDKRACVAPEGW
ncbi:hypothetical protein J3F84DRAFT_119387 [Trichoderma pleuroticola]